MRGSKLGLLAAALLAGVTGCSLPEVLPLAGGTTAGPSPYGPWYEQHWATNSVLLAAADQPDGAIDFQTEVDENAAIDAALAEGMAEIEAAEAAEAAAIEANAFAVPQPVEFSDSTPYQFPSSSFAPPPSPAPVATESPDYDLAPPVSASPGMTTAPAGGGPIRY